MRTRFLWAKSIFVVAARRARWSRVTMGTLNALALPQSAPSRYRQRCITPALDAIAESAREYVGSYKYSSFNINK